MAKTRKITGNEKQVRTTAHHTTDESKVIFIEALSKTGIVRRACEISGRNRSTIQRWQKTDLEFAQAWKEALDDFNDRLEEAAYKRGVEGIEEPVFYQGEICGEVTRYSDRLLEKMLYARNPQYKDISHVNVETQPRLIINIKRSDDD